MVKKAIVVMAIFLLSFSSMGYAQSNSLNVKAGTLGFGVEAEHAFSDVLGGRIGLNYFIYNYSGTEDDIDYSFDLNLMSLSALLDWHPFGGSFRLSGGAVYNGNVLDADANISSTYEIGDSTYTAEDIGTYKGTIDFDDVAPYFGLGWDTSFGKTKGFGFIFELGAIYQGSPQADFSADGPIANDPIFQNDLAKEEANLQSDLDGYKIFPVLTIGISYRF